MIDNCIIILYVEIKPIVALYAGAGVGMSSFAWKKKTRKSLMTHTAAPALSARSDQFVWLAYVMAGGGRGKKYPTLVQNLPQCIAKAVRAGRSLEAVLRVRTVMPTTYSRRSANGWHLAVVLPQGGSTYRSI